MTKLTGRVRGKYVERYRSGTDLILLESDVQAAFPDAEAVNEAMRMLMKVTPPSNAKANLNIGETDNIN